VREVAEEVGLDVRPTGLVGLSVGPSVGRPAEWLQHTVVLAEATADPGRVDPAEVSEWGWFSPGAVPDDIAVDHRRRIEDWAAGGAVPLPGGWPR
jgi:ADP-ribose pyrophosphatase YjhB (NUDIX family)